MTAPKKPIAHILLEDGLMLPGISVGTKGTATGEVCFNTGMTGYQEIYTDPSYFGQIIINTTSHIGNYGTVLQEDESNGPKFSGLICREFSEVYSRGGSGKSLQKYFEDHAIVGIANVDTRLLVRHIRSKGAMNAVISSEVHTRAELEKILSQAPSMAGLELSSKVSTGKVYTVGEGNPIKVAVLDIGVKKSILGNLASRGVECRVFPAKASYSEMNSWSPDGYFISNGPGDPSSMTYAVDTVKAILAENHPLFGICLGHQILALALDIPTYKMHHGHRGLNHPVKNLKTGLSEVTSQNHGFAVKEDAATLSDRVTVTHLNLNDNTIEGLEVKDKNAFSVQYHPEASPGPHDSRYLFDQFIQNIKA